METIAFMTVALIAFILWLYTPERPRIKLCQKDILDDIDELAFICCETMRAQTKIIYLDKAHDSGLRLLSKDYKGKVPDKVYEDYKELIDETYNLCKTLLKSHKIDTLSLN